MGGTKGASVARRVGFAALLLGGSQLLSRLLGVVRESLLAHLVGAGFQADAYRAAFQLPDLLNHFLAVAAIATAFIPLYQRALEQGGREAAERLFAVVWGTLTAAVAIATVALFVGAERFVALYYAGFDVETQALTVRLTCIVLPAQVFFVAGGIVRAVLMAEGRFAAQAAAPVLYNLGIIAGGVIGGGVEGFAWGALVGAAVGHFLVPIWDARGRIALRMRIAPLDADFLRYAWVALPLLAGVTLVSADEWLDRYFGQYVAEGAIALLFYARFLMQAAVGVAGQAVGTAALPAFAELHEQGRGGELSALVERTLRASLSIAIAISFGLVCVANPLVRLIYQRGAFTAGDTEAVAGLFLIFGLAIPAWVVQSVAVRAFYARGDTWRPMLLGTLVTLLAIPLYAALGERAGAPGLAIASGIAITINTLATLALARGLHGAPRLRPLLASLVRAFLCAGLAGGLAGWAARSVASLLGPTAQDAALQLVVAGIVFVAVALPLLLRFGDPPTRELLRVILRRGRPLDPAS